MPESIKVVGLREFSRSLKKIDSDLPKTLRTVHNDAANLIVDWAKPRVPSKSGRAAGTLKAKSTRTMARVSGGSAAAPYYAWLDFGGRVGVNKSVYRPFLAEGRYIYAGLAAKREDITELMMSAYVDLAQEAGLVTDHG